MNVITGSSILANGIEAKLKFIWLNNSESCSVGCGLGNAEMLLILRRINLWRQKWTVKVMADVKVFL
jgi:hypothetical protein